MNDSYEPFQMTQPLVSEAFAATKSVRELGPDEEPSLAYTSRQKHPDIVLIVKVSGTNGKEWSHSIPAYVIQEILGDSRELAEKIVRESDLALTSANEEYAVLQETAARQREERLARDGGRVAPRYERVDI